MQTHLKNIIKNIIHKAGYDITLHKISNGYKTDYNTAFIHIPKCGGTSIDTALRSQLARPGEHKIVRGPLIESSLLSFNKSILSIEDSCAFSEHHSIELQRILTYHLSMNWQYVSGHLPVNNKILRHFTNIDKLTHEYSKQFKHKQPFHFITVLRNPADRLVSNYIFNKLTNKQSVMPPTCFNTDDIINEAKTILNSKRGWQMANMPSMYLTGRFSKDENDAKSIQQEVYTNIKQFRLVGFLDDIPSFEQKFSGLTNKKLHISKRNITNKLIGREDEKVKHLLTEFFHDKQTKALVNRLCATELETYNEVRSNN